MIKQLYKIISNETGEEMDFLIDRNWVIREEHGSIVYGKVNQEDYTIQRLQPEHTWEEEKRFDIYEKKSGECVHSMWFWPNRQAYPIDKYDVKRRWKPEHTWETSDWYHTFNELYYHRTALLRAYLSLFSGKKIRSKKHFDWSEFEWYFIVMFYPFWIQCSYHIEDKYEYLFTMCEKIDRADERDWHKAQDVANILLKNDWPTQPEQKKFTEGYVLEFVSENDEYIEDGHWWMFWTEEDHIILFLKLHDLLASDDKEWEK